MKVVPGTVTLLNKLFPWLYLVGVTAALYVLLADNIYDDPFITYRYARNLAQGLGFVYNPGERVLSTTTPLFTLLLAGLSFLTTDLPHLANLIGAASLAAGALLIWDLAKTWAVPQVGWAALILYPTFTLPAAALGSETPLYISLCLATFAVYARRRYSLAAVFAALATLTRPDGILVGAVLAADYLLRIRRPLVWRPATLFLIILLPWLVFSWFYFGYPVPVTLVAKQQQSILAVSEQFGPGLITILDWYKHGWQYWVELALAMLGVYGLFHYFRPWALVLSWTALYFAAYFILGVSRYFWYYAPLVPAFIILVGLGIATLSRWVESRQLASAAPSRQQNVSSSIPGQPEDVKRAHLSNLAAAFLLALLAVTQVKDLYQLRVQTDPRTVYYRAVGEWLKANTSPDALTGSLEAGIIGYYAERPIIDFAGLLQPQVAGKMAAGGTYDDVARWTIQNYSPEYVVLVEGDMQALKQTYLDKNCHIIHRFPEETYGNTAINIYNCKYSSTIG